LQGLNPSLISQILKAFIDDSGSGGDSPWFVLAGYISSADRWDSFTAEWGQKLSAPPAIQYFKASEAEALNGQFDGFSEAERNEKIDSLIPTIQKYARQPISVRVMQKDYDEIVKPHVAPHLDNAYYFLFMSFIFSGTSSEKYFGSSEPLAFIFDSSERFERPSKRLYEDVADGLKLRNRVGEILYRDEKVFLPLQAADLLAWQVRRFFWAKSEPKRKHFDDIRKCDIPYFDDILNRKLLRSMVEKMYQKEQEIKLKLGMPASENFWDIFRRYEIESKMKNKKRNRK
jgi:hypothetical protein